MDQVFVNYALGGFGTLMGFLLKSMWQAVKDLQAADKEIFDKVASIEILVAGAYVRKDDFNESVKALFAKLDKIEDKIDKKADK